MPKINLKQTIGMDVDNCPVCNQRPKVIVDIDAFEHGVYECVTVKCHQFFHRRHLKVHGRGRTLTGAVSDGVENWNTEVRNAKLCIARKASPA